MDMGMKLQQEVDDLRAEVERLTREGNAARDQVNQTVDQYGSCEICDESTAGGVVCLSCWNRIAVVTKERDVANLQVGELKAALDRDKTGLAHALAEVAKEAKARRWVIEGRGDYAFNDDRYRQETGWALDAIEKLATEALAASGKLAHQALVTEKPKQGHLEDCDVNDQVIKGKPCNCAPYREKQEKESCVAYGEVCPKCGLLARISCTC